MAQEGKIEGKKVLITGGASGLGAAYAEAFLKHGASNVAILDIAENAGNDYAKKLNETYKNKVIFIKCDVSKEEEIKKCFQEVLKVFKRIDVIINNAGIMDDSADVWRTASDVNWQQFLPNREATEFVQRRNSMAEEWHKEVDNLQCVVSFSMKGIGHMRKDEGGYGGTIVNISSAAAFVKSDVMPIYSASKAALLHFGRSIASPEFYESTGIRILTICFWATDTPLLNNLEKKLINQKPSRILLESLSGIQTQSIPSAVEAFLKMFREGSSGSVWLSTNNLPGRDITSVLDEAYEPLLKLTMNVS